MGNNLELILQRPELPLRTILYL